MAPTKRVFIYITEDGIEKIIHSNIRQAVAERKKKTKTNLITFFFHSTAPPYPDVLQIFGGGSCTTTRDRTRSLNYFECEKNKRNGPDPWSRTTGPIGAKYVSSYLFFIFTISNWGPSISCVTQISWYFTLSSHYVIYCHTCHILSHIYCLPALLQC